MLELLKEMGTMSGKLQDLISKTGNQEEKKKLVGKYIQLTDQMKTLAKQTFDEDDGFYIETLVKVAETERVIKEVYYV